jgi:hypothetical protein
MKGTGVKTGSYCKGVLEDRLLMRMCGPMTDKVAEGRRKLHNEEPHKLYTLQNITRKIKKRRMR